MSKTFALLLLLAAFTHLPTAQAASGDAFEKCRALLLNLPATDQVTTRTFQDNGFVLINAERALTKELGEAFFRDLPRDRTIDLIYNQFIRNDVHGHKGELPSGPYDVLTHEQLQAFQPFINWVTGVVQKSVPQERYLNWRNGFIIPSRAPFKRIVFKPDSTEIRVISRYMSDPEIYQKHEDGGDVTALVTLLGPGTFYYNSKGVHQTSVGDVLIFTGNDHAEHIGIPALTHSAPAVDGPRVLLLMRFTAYFEK